VDYTTTSGTRARWTGGPTAYSDMASNDRKALTYTTEPLVEPVEIVGHPVAHLWLQAPTDDIDVFIYLEEVDPQGQSRYITEGCLRASHRAVAKSPYTGMDLPYHPCSQKSAEKLAGNTPVELVFDLLPTARHFPAGSRIRVAITCADKDNCQSLEHRPAPTVRVLRDGQRSSHVVFPVLKD
jgi:hypothetical protein